ncbi:hypothetical protein BN961_00838 [Afipia felis]|uniref:Uncharacterized protein n=1 Tax=Afipia felis TaxID=1035 RepID=A0A090N6U2_AFIFE|nr:hypothetical protein BN961_00838 [Afipia felis]
MMARGMTIPAAAPMPCTTRAAISHSTLGANAQPIEPTMNSVSPA